MTTREPFAVVVSRLNARAAELQSKLADLPDITAGRPDLQRTRRMLASKLRRVETRVFLMRQATLFGTPEAK